MLIRQIVLPSLVVCVLAAEACAQRQMEGLGRGTVAIRTDETSVFIGWRLLGTEPQGTAFNVYRSTGGGKQARLNDEPLAKGTNFIDSRADLSQTNTWSVRPVLNGREGDAGSDCTLAASSPVRPYLSIPLKTPDGYTPNDASVGDLDGDGEYEIVLHQVGRGRDNSQAGTTTEPVLQGYKLDGTRLRS
jgi:rhamnogalacturonan endolyase